MDSNYLSTKSYGSGPFRPAFPLLLITLAASSASTYAAESATTPAPAYVPTLKFSETPAGHYKLDPDHSHLEFQLVHYGGLSRPNLTFRKVEADYILDPKHPEATKIEARVQPTSLDSGDRDFDMRMNAPDVLRGYDHSDGLSGKYRYITFESTQITFIDGNRGVMMGDLTLLGITHPIKIDFTYNGYFKNVLGYQKMGFSGNGKLKRSDYGMTSVPTAGDEVTFTLEFEFMRDGAASTANP
jgi:polyisoprenoid-binding protein YceI